MLYFSFHAVHGCTENVANKMLGRRRSVSNFRDRVGGGSVNMVVIRLNGAMEKRIKCRRFFCWRCDLEQTSRDYRGLCARCFKRKHPNAWKKVSRIFCFLFLIAGCTGPAHTSSIPKLTPEIAKAALITLAINNLAAFEDFPPDPDLFSIGTYSPQSASQEPEKNLGQLARYEGDWIIARNRRSVRVVSHSDANSIQTFQSVYSDNFGCPGVSFYSMRMTFDPASGEYRGQVKWDGNTIEEHLKQPWLPHDLIGTWNPETKTMTWANAIDADHQFKRIEITTHFPDDNKQTAIVFETVDGKRKNELFGTFLERIR